jgi:flagellar biosynthesis GTPase FlhF
MVDGCLVEIRPATIALGDEKIVSHKVHTTHVHQYGKNVTIMRNVTIIHATDGSVGLCFLRPNKTTNGPFEVTELVLNGTAERNCGVQVGDTILAVNGRDISCLSAADVALLVCGQPATALELAILTSNTGKTHTKIPTLEDKKKAAIDQTRKEAEADAKTLKKVAQEEADKIRKEAVASAETLKKSAQEEARQLQEETDKTRKEAETEAKILKKMAQEEAEKTLKESAMSAEALKKANSHTESCAEHHDVKSWGVDQVFFELCKFPTEGVQSGEVDGESLVKLYQDPDAESLFTTPAPDGLGFNKLMFKGRLQKEMEKLVSK